MSDNQGLLHLSFGPGGFQILTAPGKQAYLALMLLGGRAGLHCGQF